MKTLRIGVCLFAFSLLTIGLSVSEAKAVGPVAAQQAVSQMQSGLTDASVGCRRCWYRGGYSVGYYGYGYPSYGYYGWGYSRPVIYSYPAYSYVRYRRPVYYSGYYGYAPTYSSCNCGGYAYSTYQPSVYSISSSYTNSYQTTSPVVYSNPNYTTGNVYSLTPTSTYSAPVYTPSYTSPTVISAPTPIAPSTSTSTPAPAPYPAPPVEYAQPSAYRAPIATLPMETASSVYSQTQNAPISMIHTPAYSANFTTSNVAYSAYSPVSYNYSATSSMVNRLYSGSSPW